MSGRATTALLLVAAATGLIVGRVARNLAAPDHQEGPSGAPAPAAARGGTTPGPAVSRPPRSRGALPPRPARPPTLVGGIYAEDEVARASTASLTASRSAASVLERRALTRIAGSDDGLALVDCAGSAALPPTVVVELRVVSEPSRIAVTDLRVVADHVAPSLATCIAALARGLEERSDPAIPFLRGDAWLRHELQLPHGRD